MALELGEQVIESQRLWLKPIAMDYAEAIFANFNAEITRYMYPKPARIFLAA